MLRMIVIATSITAAFQAAAQEDVPQNFSVWPGLELYMPFQEGSRWGLFAEGYVKRVNFLKDPQGLFWRLGGSYYLKNGNRISGGVAWQYNYPYDNAALPYSWADSRIWQQYMIRHVSAKNKEHLWVHRLRLEERWLARKNDPANDGYDYYEFETTSRYMLRSQWYVKPRLGVAVYDEVHLRIYSQERDEKIFDQNRIYAGVDLCPRQRPDLAYRDRLHVSFHVECPRERTRPAAHKPHVAHHADRRCAAWQKVSTAHRSPFHGV